MKGFYDRTLDSAADLADNLMLINARERVTRGGEIFGAD